jgi:2-succinyl-6-hydroxy-2,4-cyclohexadiene-1-carboxylate synthase
MVTYDPIVVLHGFLGGSESFFDVIAAFPAPISPLAPTLYGHAGVTESAPIQSFETEADRLLCLIRRHYAGRLVHLVGYSLGGRLALSLLLRAPSLFRSATLVCARRGLDTPEEREERSKADLIWAHRLRTEPLTDFLDAWESQAIFSSMRRLPQAKLRRLRDQRLNHDSEGLAQALIGLSLSNMPSYAEDLARIRLPLTLVSGSLDDKFTHLAEDLATRLPSSHTIVVKDAGHNLPLERPDAVAAAIIEGMKHA